MLLHVRSPIGVLLGPILGGERQVLPVVEGVSTSPTAQVVPVEEGRETSRRRGSSHGVDGEGGGEADAKEQRTGERSGLHSSSHLHPKWTHLVSMVFIAQAMILFDELLPCAVRHRNSVRDASAVRSAWSRAGNSNYRAPRSQTFTTQRPKPRNICTRFWPLAKRSASDFWVWAFRRFGHWSRCPKCPSNAMAS